MKNLIVLIFVVTTVSTVFAQRKTFNIVSYTSPANGTEKPGIGNISYSRIEGGNWARPDSKGTRRENNLPEPNFGSRCYTNFKKDINHST